MAHKYVFIELIQWTITVPLLLFILHMEEGAYASSVSVISI